MYILGISCFFHDAAAALVKDGVLVAAAEEERFSRKKHDYEGLLAFVHSTGESGSAQRRWNLWFHDALVLNVHIHSLVLAGVFTRSMPTAAPVFHALPAPTDAEVAEVLGKFHRRVQRLLRRRGRLPEEESSPIDPVAEQMPLLAEYASASIQGLVASGPRAGHLVRRLRSAAAVVDGAKPRCARLEGFSLHANVGVPAHARARLEHLCR